MERLGRHTHISFISCNENYGTGFISLNFSMEILSRNHSVIYTTSESDYEKRKFFNYIKPVKKSNSVDIQDSRINKFRIISFSDDFDSRYSENAGSAIKSVNEPPDFFIHNIRNPLSSPYNRLLADTDKYVLVLRIGSSAVSDYFGIIKKLQMLEKHPAKVYLIFNHTKDIERAFEIYQKILKDTMEFRSSVLPVFLGIIPNDPLRQALSVKLRVPLRVLFSESGISGSLSFVADKLLGAALCRPADDTLPALYNR